MIPYKKILFVCRNNEALSLMAEAILNHVQQSFPEEKRIPVTSRGLVVLFSEPVNPKAVAVLAQNHLKLPRETTRGLAKEDLTADTMIVTMNEKEKRMVEEMFPGVLNLYQLRDFAGEGGEVTEPYGGSVEDYETVYEHLDLTVKLMSEKIWRKTQEEET